MAADLVESKLENDESDIEDAKESDQVRELLEEASRHAKTPVYNSSTAFYIEGRMGIAGVRVELEYDIRPHLDGPFPVEDASEAQLDISQYRANAGEIETTGYLREGNVLLMELETNDDLMPQVLTESYDGNTYIQIEN
jgi:hypothetical protein